LRRLARCLLAFQQGEMEDGEPSENALLGAMWHAQLQRAELQAVTRGGA